MTTIALCRDDLSFCTTRRAFSRVATGPSVRPWFGAASDPLQLSLPLAATYTSADSWPIAREAESPKISASVIALTSSRADRDITLPPKQHKPGAGVVVSRAKAEIF